MPHLAQSATFSSPARVTALSWALLGYLFFVVYGSLIPFEFRPISFGEGWEQFTRARYLSLGVGSRADWIANIVLYVPLSFLGVTWAHRRLPPETVSPMRVIAVLFACGLIAFGLEFLQVFVKPRTVSQNDLIAELIGSCFGIALWYVGRARLLRGLASLGEDARTAIVAALWFYLVFYVLLSLFPYDFLVSLEEMSWKLDTGRVAVLLAPDACSQPLRCVAKFAAEAIAVAPLGLLVALGRGGQRSSLSGAFLYGCLLGLGIETAQLLMASGVSQGISVLTRGAGAVLGAGFYRWARVSNISGIASTLAPFLLIAFVPYVILLMSLNGWFAAPWKGLDEALAGLEGQNFLPFYYHYFTSEASAMDSLLANAAIYAPIGLGYWIWGVARGRDVTTAAPAVLAAGVALVIESGKLFVVGKHADPTNILIAAAAAAGTFFLSKWLYSRNVPLTRPMVEPVDNVGAKGDQLAVVGSGNLLAWLLTLTLLLLASWAALRYPAGGVMLLVLLVVYAVALWMRPQLWLFVVPALLPVFDFAAWSGWFFATEYDLLLMVTLAILVTRTDWHRPAPALPRSTSWALAAFAVTYAVSLVKGLLPLQPLEPSSFSNYYSQYNALRVGKGVLWALALLPFLARAFQSSDTIKKYFVPGMLTGLAVTVLLIVYERWAFPGLLNLSSSFRATGFFSSMHVGGASVDAYLAMALPFVTLLFLLWRNPWSYIAGFLLYAAGVYAFLVTFSRINFFALGVMSILILFGLVRDRLLGRHYFTVALPLVLITVFVSVPLFSAPFTSERFANLGEDAASRRDHWEQALSLRGDDPVSRIFGMGIGSFPRLFFWADPGSSRPASFAYLNEEGNGFLRLGSGRPVYILQRVRPGRDHGYLLSIDLRATGNTRGITAMICEKPLLYTRRCESTVLGVDSNDHDWQSMQAELVAHGYGASGRSVYLVIFNPHLDTVIDVDNISLQSPSGVEMLVNGTFSKGNDRWFFTSDDHSSWRVDNIWVHILFEQGWLGVVTFGLLLMITLRRLGGGAWQGDSLSLVLLASLVAALVVGLVDSIVEAPRIALLMFLLLFIALYHSEMRRNA